MSLIMAEDIAPSMMVADVPLSPAPPVHHRLGIPTPLRITYVALLSCVAGAMLGAAREGTSTALRFRAENAHRLPTSTKGWYLYHKSKNYAVMFESIKTGARLAGKFALWVTFFSGTEAMIDKIYNPKKDFRSSFATGVVTAMIWSRWYELSRPATGRMLLFGAKAGLVYGLTQDALAYYTGRTTLSRLVPRFPEESDAS